jgi:hypothetical protein
MPNQKISELTAIVTVDNSVDVLPIVDISANTTKKVTPNALKTALALDNVNNTSDANKPVSIAQQDALNAKVDENAAITAGTAPKITFDAKGLVTSGDSLDETDLPTGINANKIGTGGVSSTEFGYLDGVTSAIQTQINSKQATLVSGTNIKTINSTSLLGSGDITISASPSGVSGAIQFSNGSAFASDAANLFWDDTNKRWGVGTNVPTRTLDVRGSAFIQNVSGTDGSIQIGTNLGGIVLSSANRSEIQLATNARMTTRGTGITFRANSGEPNGAVLGVVGSGSTSATTSLLVQNSGGTNIFRILDDGIPSFGGVGLNGKLNFNRSSDGGGIAQVGTNGGLMTFTEFSGSGFRFDDGFGKFPLFMANGKSAFNKGSAAAASAQVEIVSTTGGFLPPVMTTTQKNAIASPASGLILYDSTTNKLQCYNGSTWNDLF